MATVFVAETKLLVLHVVFRGKKFNQYHFLAARATELPGKAQTPSAT
jgi:hypothetical protein